MSYARFGPHSDVYVYADVSGGLTCCICRVNQCRTVRLHDLPSALIHFDVHRAMCQKVPGGWPEFKRVITAHEDYLFNDGPEPDDDHG